MFSSSQIQVALNARTSAWPCAMGAPWAENVITSNSEISSCQTMARVCKLFMASIPNGIIFHQPRFPWFIGDSRFPSKKLPFGGPGRAWGLQLIWPELWHLSWHRIHWTPMETEHICCVFVLYDVCLFRFRIEQKTNIWFHLDIKRLFWMTNQTKQNKTKWTKTSKQTNKQTNKHAIHDTKRGETKQGETEQKNTTK